MAKSRSRTKQKLFSASSEQRKGFTMPTMKKIKSVLMSRSKTFLVNLVLGMMVGMSKSAKIKVLVKIEKGTIARKVKRKSAIKKPKSNNNRKKPRSPAQKRATRKLVALNKKRRR